MDLSRSTYLGHLCRMWSHVCIGAPHGQWKGWSGKKRSLYSPMGAWPVMARVNRVKISWSWPAIFRNRWLAGFQALGIRILHFFLRVIRRVAWNSANFARQLEMAKALCNLRAEAVDWMGGGEGPMKGSFMELSACSLSGKPSWLGTQTNWITLRKSDTSHSEISLLMSNAVC